MKHNAFKHNLEILFHELRFVANVWCTEIYTELFSLSRGSLVSLLQTLVHVAMLS